jgi:hypothetical protein
MTFPAADLLQVNTHIDPIDWHGTRSLADPVLLIESLAAAIKRRVAGEADRDEPIGFLTHHLMHDEAIWSFCEELMMQLSLWDVPLLTPAEVFSRETGSQPRLGAL